MTKKEKEIKAEFDRKTFEAEKLGHKINIYIWKMKRPQDIQSTDKMINEYKKILEILESE